MTATTISRPGVLVQLRSFVELAKPSITVMVLVTSAIGIWLAPATVSPWQIGCAVAGITLVVSGANALNMFLEQEQDAKMARTRARPLPTGRLQARQALLFGLATSTMAIVLLASFVNATTALLATASLILYVCAYTPLKRIHTGALLVGAVPGAIPPILGWTATGAPLNATALALFLIMFVWQLPHFLAISLFRREDYAAAGFKVVSVVRGVPGTKERIALYSALLLCVSLQLVRTGLGGAFYLSCALILGGGLVTLALYGLQKESGNRWARWFFFYTLVYLPALLVALAIDRIWR